MKHTKLSRKKQSRQDWQPVGLAEVKLSKVCHGLAGAEGWHLDGCTGSAVCLTLATKQEARLSAPKGVQLTAGAPCRAARFSAEDPH